MKATAMHRVLVVGTGSIGERHLRCLLATGRVTAGMVEVNPKLRQDVAQRYSVPEVFDSLEAALKKSWSAAVIATPASMHVQQARQVADAGLNFLLEKPVSISLDGVDALLEKVRAKKLVVSVGYTHRAHPALTAMRAAVRSGRFGRPLQLIGLCGQHFPTFRPAYRQTYFTRHASGGGAIQDMLTHVFNAGEWLVGPIEKVCADARHQFLDGVEVEDTAHVMTRQGGVLGCYTLNMYQAPNEVAISVVCERGTARYEVPQHRWRWMDQPNSDWHEEPFPLKERDDWFILQEQRYLDALEGKSEPLCSLADGIQTLRVNLAALASVRDGQWKPVA